MNEILVSIVVPVYNVECYLENCIKSLLNQSLKEIEIILIDDGSEDGSGVICDRYVNLDKRIKVIHQKNVGLGLARNAGINVANGEYIGFVDSDDFVSSDMFKILYDNAKLFSADISYCQKEKFFDENTLKDFPIENNTICYEKEDIKTYLFNRIGMAPNEKKDTLYQTAVWLGIYKRKIIEDNNIRFVSERKLISEDIIYNIDIITRCNCIVHSNAKLYYYRYNPNSLTTSYKKDRFSKNVIMYKEICDKLNKIFPNDDFTNAVDRYLITYSRIACMQEVDYIKINGRTAAKKNITDICNNILLKSVLKRYPYRKLPFKYMCVCVAQKYKLINLIIFMMGKRY